MADLTALIQERLRVEHAADPSFYEPSPGQLVDHVHNRVARVAAEVAKRWYGEQRPKSAELAPGTTIRFLDDPDRTYTLERRKSQDEGVLSHPGWWMKGWWVKGGGGFADFVLDDERNRWVVVTGEGTS